VFKALQEKLLRQDLFDEFYEEFTRGMNRLRMEHRASLSAAQREIAHLEARRELLLDMVMEGRGTFGGERRAERECKLA
jgi:hypothetical protein